MKIDVWSDTIDIARPPDDVTGYAFDPANDPAWIGGIRTAQLRDATAGASRIWVRRLRFSASGFPTSWRSPS